MCVCSFISRDKLEHTNYLGKLALADLAKGKHFTETAKKEFAARSPAALDLTVRKKRCVQKPQHKYKQGSINYIRLYSYKLKEL